MLLLYPHPKRYEYVMGGFTFHYASTISFSTLLSNMQLAALHSTMLLLYRNNSVLHMHICLALHSTMLLLYPITLPSGRIACSTLYIPLCFYYIIWTSAITKRLITFTFHYASTISMFFRFLTFSLYSLYIPLCFYYILMMISPSSFPYSTLHSTMLLLYRNSDSCNYNIICFTFHYASTISIVHTAHTKRIRTFTFHYASTISKALKEWDITMHQLYIPLCFYYIRYHFVRLPCW